MLEEKVVLVDELNNQLGTMSKLEAHEKGLLHRAFSVFLFNRKQELLLQRRAIDKYHSGGLWTNTCCSHPKPEEPVSDAASRRLMEEMGIQAPIHPAFDFIYKANFENGLTEHEYDHVFVGEFNGTPLPNRDEVSDWSFVSLEQLQQDIERNPHKFTEWFKIAIPKLLSYLGLKVSSYSS